MFSESTRVVHDKFAEYYAASNTVIRPPNGIGYREFGFFLFRKGVMLRHRSFDSISALEAFLSKTTPSDIYYSSAYYEIPEKEMEEKGFLGADLVFDIDADHIPTPCDKIHDSWICSNCRFVGKGPAPEECPACSSSRFEAKTWTCEVCLKSAKNETIKLTEMLVRDFGFSEKEITVYFSGNRGYHVHVEDESVWALDSLARKEIVDYVIGLGFKAGLHGVVDSQKRVSVDRDAQGWKRRVADGVETFLKKATAAQIEATGLNKRSADILNRNRRRLLENLEKDNYLEVKGISPNNWRKVIEWIVDQQSAKIDTVVTTDTHRLIRLAGSLHGKTGLMKTEAPLSGFDAFDPLKEAIAFKDGHLVVDVAEAPEFRIGDNVYGPFQNAGQMELPTAAALFLCCKGAAMAVRP